MVSEVIGNLHESKLIRVSETQLILAKIRLSKVAPSSCIKETSSDDLMVELENDLGHAITSYLTVRLTYKHSAFANHKMAAEISDGMTSHVTRLQTEATASIKRHNLQSAWSPRTSQTMSTPLATNPLIDLIKAYLPSGQAREAVRKLAEERAPIPMAKRFGDPGSSEETVKPENSGIAAIIESASSGQLIQPTTSESLSVLRYINGKSDSFTNILDAQSDNDQHYEDIDPARKIWSEMRRHSRGGQHRHARTSIGAAHYFSAADDPSPRRMSSGRTSVSTLSNGVTGMSGNGDSIDQERTRIMEVALRNKRSVGAETLRSIAPSVTQTVGRAKGGTMNGLGLGARTWGWGPPWW